MDNLWDMIVAAPRVFMSITIPDVIDIILLTLLIIAIIRFMSETRATQLLKGIGVIALIYILVKLGQLRVMTYLFDTYVIPSILVVIVVVFQPEIRRLLEKMGTVKIPFLAYFEKEDAKKAIERDQAITAISDACERLSRTKTGALIVIERKTKLKDIIEKSTVVDAKPSPELFCNLFYNKSPLHDGAVIIRNNRIYAAGCFLPLPDKQGPEYIDPELGSRHRAGIGMSENSDAVVVIVSEETGTISVAKSGQITRSTNEYDPKEWLLKILRDEMPLPVQSKAKSIFKKKKSDSDEGEVEE